jgi:hypothetical protein
MTTLPHSRCNLIEERILIGTAPTLKTLPLLLNFRIICFVNLCGEPLLFDYQTQLPSSITYIPFPIQSGKAPTCEKAKELIDYLYQEWLENNSFIYIHCHGGHGRSGLIAALLYGTIHKVSAVSAIRAVEQSRASRIDKSRNFIPTPETKCQVKLVVQFLGLGPNESIPNRSDKSWIQRVQKERKQKVKTFEEINL